MNNSSDSIDDDVSMTLDPPGSIAVVGAGVLGIEAALYGRFLGYNVTLIEAVAVGHSLPGEQETPLPMLPDRCLSPLAVSALESQQRDSTHLVLPTTYQQWINNALVPLTETDLLRDRLRMPMRATEIIPIEVQAGGEDDGGGEIPPDFRLSLVGTDGQTEWVDVEAVILSVGLSCDIDLRFQPSTPYLFRIGATSTTDAEQGLRSGLREIVAIYARLSGRSDLDLFRPSRG
jgi:hypothetical protein